LHQKRTHIALLLAAAVVLVWSATGPREFQTWGLEVFPALIAAPVLIWRYPYFRFTTLVYALIAIHASILMVGGHYTYAEVPLFNWIRDHWGLSRNYYDRVGHFAQGFVPAVIAREVLLRKTRLERGKLLAFLCICICMAISAWYEIMEFAVARTIGDSAENFLGTQGDPWDTQWDMTFAFIGSSMAIATLSRWHDRQLSRIS